MWLVAVEVAWHACSMVGGGRVEGGERLAREAEKKFAPTRRQNLGSTEV